MGMDLGGGYGAGGAITGLQQLVAQRFLERQQAEREAAMQAQAQQAAFHNALALRGENRADKQLEETTALRKAQQDASIQQHQQQAADKLVSELAPNQSISPSTGGMLRTTGRGDLVKENPAAAGDQFLSAPAEFQPGSQPGMIFTGTGAQLNAERKSDQADRAQNERERENRMRDESMNRRLDIAESKAAQGPSEHYTLQPEVDPATGKQTGRFLGYNTKTNRFAPITGVLPTGTKAAPGAAQAASDDRTKKETLDTLAQLDAAIEAAKDKIGPGAGRVSNIEQMIGNADPAIQALGVKMKAAKMRVDHALTGSVRAGASPMMLKQWDNILANNITPEGLKAGVQAMREILGGQAAAPTQGAKPSAADLIKKYGGR